MRLLPSVVPVLHGSCAPSRQTKQAVQVLLQHRVLCPDVLQMFREQRTWTLLRGAIKVSRVASRWKVLVQEVAALSEALTGVCGEEWRSLSRQTVAVYVRVCFICVVRDSEQGDWCDGPDTVCRL